MAAVGAYGVGGAGAAVAFAHGEKGRPARAHWSSHIFARTSFANPWESSSSLRVSLGGAGTEDARLPRVWGGPSVCVAPSGFLGTPKLPTPARRLWEQCLWRGTEQRRTGELREPPG